MQNPGPHSGQVRSPHPAHHLPNLLFAFTEQVFQVPTCLPAGAMDSTEPGRHPDPNLAARECALDKVQEFQSLGCPPDQLNQNSWGDLGLGMDGPAPLAPTDAHGHIQPGRD